MADQILGKMKEIDLVPCSKIDYERLVYNICRWRKIYRDINELRIKI
jgi:hypothetical protein